jgi:hypothetical protein
MYEILRPDRVRPDLSTKTPTGFSYPHIPSLSAIYPIFSYQVVLADGFHHAAAPLTLLVSRGRQTEGAGHDEAPVGFNASAIFSSARNAAWSSGRGRLQHSYTVVADRRVSRRGCHGALLEAHERERGRDTEEGERKVPSLPDSPAPPRVTRGMEVGTVRVATSV